ncbi:MAG: H-type lectin domain-containing protein [Magnetococcales bacterium]|nr:H-type lectin domain-containing protein [Magnetococcales bacterium]
MIRLFGVSLAVVVILVFVLVSRGALPVSETAGGSWRGWWMGGERLERLQAEFVKLEQDHQRLSQETAKRIAALEERIESQQSRLSQLDAPGGGGSIRGRLESGSVTAKQEDKEWKLANLFNRAREFRQRVEFPRPFAKPPKVIMGMVGMDFNQEKIQFVASAEEIDAKGFTVLFVTRAEERPREVRVEWLAFGQ